MTVHSSIERTDRYGSYISPIYSHSEIYVMFLLFNSPYSPSLISISLSPNPLLYPNLPQGVSPIGPGSHDVRVQVQVMG